ncbi:MAG: STAS domain-containing protein [Spirochaetota bacterium]
MESADIKEENGEITIRLHGNVSYKTGLDLKNTITAYADKGNAKIYLDLSESTFLDSSGIGLLLNSQKYVEKQKGTLTIQNLNEKLYSLIKMANLDKKLNIE